MEGLLSMGPTSSSEYGSLGKGSKKKTEESVTTFHLGLPPPLVWPELGEIFSAFFAGVYYIGQTMKQILVSFSMF